MKHRASFRDPSGFLFYKDGVLYRQVNPGYQDHYVHLLASGLYEKCAAKGLLVRHEEADAGLSPDGKAFKVIRPAMVPFISYPYEWCFSQLKAAALATLEMYGIAMKHGMILKDSSAYNIQFMSGRPVLIDSLSFEKQVPGKPWVGYGQFCRHFLAPLALMAKKDVRLQHLLRVYIDGIPLDCASRLLPWTTKLDPRLFMHIHLHAGSYKKYAGKKVDMRKVKVGAMANLGLVDSLSNAVQSLAWEPEGTEWAEYYTDTNYTEQGLISKKEIVATIIEKVKPAMVWDLGANDGTFSRIAAAKAGNVISFDVDPAAVEKNYRQAGNNNEKNLLPILLDLANPSAGIGWANSERSSLTERGPVDLVMALALVHHLAIGNNVPFDAIAAFFAQLCRYLLIEFVPKEDSQVKRLLQSREDVFMEYDEERFLKGFGKYFTTVYREPVKESKRVMFLFEKSR